MPTAALALLLLALAEPPAGPPRFRLHTAAAQVQAGPVERIGEDFAVTLGTPGKKPVPGADVVSLRREGVPLPPNPSEPQLVFADGDRLPGRAVSADADFLHFRPLFRRREGPAPEPETSVLKIPRKALSVLWLAPPPRDGADPAKTRWLSEPRRRDVLLLRNGDTLRGTFAGIDPKRQAVLFRDLTATEPAPVPLTKVAAIAFNPELASLRPPRGPYGHLVLANGARLTVASVQSDGRTLTAITLFGEKLSIPLADVVALDVRQGRAAYLSDLKPLRTDYTWFGSVAWPWAADRSVAGRELRVGGQTYDKGLGTHSRTVLTYALGGKYRRFEAVVGLDDQTGLLGSAEVRVLVDGKPQKLPGPKELTHAAGPLELSIDVAGAKELTLEVLFGTGGDVQDHVDWADARLIK